MKAEPCTRTKLLLVGPGESGKSTIFKNIIECYGKGFPEEERKTYAGIIASNLDTSMRTLLRQARERKIDFSPDPTASSIASLLEDVPYDAHTNGLSDDRGDDTAFREEMAAHLKYEAENVKSTEAEMKTRTKAQREAFYKQFAEANVLSDDDFSRRGGKPRILYGIYIPAITLGRRYHDSVTVTTGMADSHEQLADILQKNESWRHWRRDQQRYISLQRRTLPTAHSPQLTAHMTRNQPQLTRDWMMVCVFLCVICAGGGGAVITQNRPNHPHTRNRTYHSVVIIRRFDSFCALYSPAHQQKVDQTIISSYRIYQTN